MLTETCVSNAIPAIGGFRISPQQHRLWSLSLRDSAPAYCSQCLLVVEGGIQLETLRDAVGRVVGRHEILRTTFHTLPGLTVPVQVVGDTAMFEWRTVDLSGVGPEALDAALDGLRRDERVRPFDAAAGPLVRVAAATLGPGTFALVVTCSGLCADGASLHQFTREIVQAVAPALSAALESEEPLQYADFAEWEHQRLESLEGTGPALIRGHPPQVLRTRNFRHSIPDTSRTVFRRISFFVSNASRARRVRPLPRCCSPAGTSCSGVLANIPRSGCLTRRVTRSSRSAIGPFERYRSLAVALYDDMPLDELIVRVSEQAHAADAADAGPESAFGDRLPDTPPRFGFDRRRRAVPYASGGLSISMRNLYGCSDRCSLRLCYLDDADLEFHFDPSCFAPSEVQRLAERYVVVLHRIAQDPHGSLASFDVTLPAERRQLLVGFQPDASLMRIRPGPSSAWWKSGRSYQADRMAVWCDGRELTYGQLNARANQWARVLRARGVGPEILVGLCVQRSLDAVVSILAIWKAGGAYVPLDPAYPRERLAFMLSDAKPAVVLTHSALAGLLPSCDTARIFLDWDAPEADAQPDNALDCNAPVDRLAYVMYTSGTTGEPKGVMITHANLGSYVRALQASLQIADTDRYLHTASFAFSSSVRQLLLPLCRGASLILARQEDVKAPLTLFELIRRVNVTVIDVVPTFWRTCIQILSRLDATAKATAARQQAAADPLRQRAAPGQHTEGVGLRPGTPRRHGEHVRPDGDLGHRRDVSDSRRREQPRRRAGRPADRERAGLHSELPISAGAHRRVGGNSRRGNECRPRLSQPARTDRGEVHPRSVQRQPRRATVQDGRSRPLLARRHDRAARPARFPDQDPGVPGRAEGDRSSPGAAPRCARCRRGRSARG